MINTLEKPVKKEKKPFDPSTVDPKLYFLCVRNAAGKSKADLEKLVDNMLTEVLRMGEDNISQFIKDQLAVFAYLSLRRKN